MTLARRALLASSALLTNSRAAFAACSEHSLVDAFEPQSLIFLGDGRTCNHPFRPAHVRARGCEILLANKGETDCQAKERGRNGPGTTHCCYWRGTNGWLYRV